MIPPNGPWAWHPVQGLIEDLANHLIRHPNTDFQHKAVAISAIHNRQDPEGRPHSYGAGPRYSAIGLRRTRFRFMSQPSRRSHTQIRK